MKALVYHGPARRRGRRWPDPKIVAPTDVIVRVDTTTICGTDLHILKGDVPAVTDGRILGHEGIGTIIEIGSAVSKLAVGDRVIISCITSCGACSYCHQQLPAHCSTTRAHPGSVDLRAPHRRHPSRVRTRAVRRGVLHKLPDGISDEAAVMLSDILRPGSRSRAQRSRQAGRRRRRRRGRPRRPGGDHDRRLYGASRIIAIDLDDNRIDQARSFGATEGVTAVTHLEDEVCHDRRPRRRRGDRGGRIPPTFEMCTELVRRAGPSRRRRARQVGGAQAPGPVDQGHRG